MKLLILSLSFPIVILAGCSQDSPMLTDIDKTQVPQYSIEDFMNSTSYSGASFSPDNDKLLVSDNSTGIFNVYALQLTAAIKNSSPFLKAMRCLRFHTFRKMSGFCIRPIRVVMSNHLYMLEMDG